MQILVVRKCISEILDQPRQSLFFILKICRETICFGSFFPSRKGNFRLEPKQGVNIYFNVYVSMRNKKIKLLLFGTKYLVKVFDYDNQVKIASLIASLTL